MLILITNNTLANRAGTELYVRDLALGLLNRGHTPVAYSSRLGDVANELGAAGVRVVDDLEMVTAQPDIIHGHHHLDTMTAVLHFPGTPAIFVCHGSTPWEEGAPQFPRILRYVAVDHACRDRLVIDHEIPEDRVRVVLNFVDLERFKPRGRLPDRPHRALIFSNRAPEHAHAVRAACESAGLLLDVVGSASGNACAEPEAMLGNYDIIFAKGRAALEALAVGAAVVLCDAAGAGPMVTTENVEQLRPLNFGIRALREVLNAEVISREIARYDPINAITVSGHIRATAGRDKVLDELLSLYQEVIEEHSQIPEPNRVAEQRAVATYLRDLAPRLFQRNQAMHRLAVTENELEMTRAQLEMIRNSRSWRMVTRYAAIKHKLLGPSRRVSSAPFQPRTSTGKTNVPEAEPRSARSIFTEIYQRRDWGNGESSSGPGSSVARATAFADEMTSLLTQIKAKSLLDAGCGDFNWLKEAHLDLMCYVGIDVVPELVARNQRAYGSGVRNFVNLDMTKDALPQVDVILCRDSLVHLSLKDSLAALENFKRSGSTYLLTTTFIRFPENLDICTGQWRQLNFQKAPFNFPEPVRLIDERCTHSNGVFADKHLGLWAIENIP